jgi:hypothetical protein
VDWLGNDVGIFWICGKPGAGKSALMKYIIDHLEMIELFAIYQKRAAISIGFFSHDLGAPSEETFSGLLHALLFQLLADLPGLLSSVQSRFQRVRKRWATSSADATIWSKIELKGTFLDIQQYSDLETSILCVIDRLDGCEAKSIPDMLSFLRSV